MLKARSLFTPLIYHPKIKYKDGSLYFWKNKKYRTLETEKKKQQIFLSYFTSENPNFS